ncbi:hypothetical protein NOF04DRAFT_9499 [Fusarium oxysporum II5]|uniref:Uncharacterized protein n=2 Tax=Fusarium oxysporum species complex TaxID=171631 RepID=X0KH19_FUSO5|nr:uncharacterized protein FOIG_11178 [Fusarium odoratissimum NRRL 54006]EXL96209.1 hypothetical protein FOIG_11178 [Fusarium odoratissimum NRRL 54006]KAK2125411.1 hypothetical protein NOF04DRAFT_9499 [Fusarium oxysporum II5]TXC00364.1 hypothetical protein FocTR4_00013579 [Fusarium oxysporum f. sp. cubense]
MGDVPDEKELYKLVNSPDSLSSLHMQLENYYPRPVCDALFPLYDVPKPGSKDDKPGTYAELYAPIVADAQVPASHRGFAHLLLNPPKVDGTKTMPPGRVHRYRIPWRAKGLDAWLRKEVGVCYSADMQNWMLRVGVRILVSQIRRKRKRSLNLLENFCMVKRLIGATSRTKTVFCGLIRKETFIGTSKILYGKGGWEVWNAMMTAQKQHLEAS